MKTQLLLVIFLLISALSFSQNDEAKAEMKTTPFQFTLLTPPIGTNGIYFYKTANDVSLNTFIGVSAATNYVELGGFLNVDRFYANGVQAAGFANINGFDPKAKDLTSEGVQGAGFANINANNYKGIQLSGFLNKNRNFEGLQASGFANINQSTKNSYEISGFANISPKGESHIQASGFINIAENLKGIQGSGFINIAKDVKGIQGTGFANIANDVVGVQASGFANVAKHVKGIQASGFINICDSIDGIPISFISIVKKGGYRNFEISTTDWSPVQLTYRMGIEKFYNVYSISKLRGNWDRYAFGFGFGHNRKIFNDKTSLNIEAVHHQEFVWNPQHWVLFTTDRFNNLTQLKLGIRRNIYNNIWVNAGPTLNCSYSYNYSNNADPKTEDFKPYWNVSTKTYDDYPKWSSKFWVGFHAGINLY